MYRAVVAATLTLLFVVVGFALVVPIASAQCGGPEQPPCPTCGGPEQPPCPTCGGPEQPPCEVTLCHNIGGPRNLGANCDGTGTCTYDTGSGSITVAVNNFLGIIIGVPTSGPALDAHLKHGDGPVLATFNPPLHLASQGQNHQAANVECLGLRVVPQPTEPGN
jgi:hypothetical protein